MLEWVMQTLEGLKDQPALGAVFIGLYVLSCIFLLPGFILTYGAGVLFGPLYGALMVVSGACLGASCAFLISRYLISNRVRRRLQRKDFFQKLDRVVQPDDFFLILLIRLCPLVPFRTSNYLLGITKISYRHFLAGSVLGVAPGATLYVHAGALFGKLTDLNQAGIIPGSSETRTVFFVSAVITSAMLCFVLYRYAKRRLNERLENA